MTGFLASMPIHGGLEEEFMIELLLSGSLNNYRHTNKPWLLSLPTHFYELSMPTKHLKMLALHNLSVLTLTFMRGSRGGTRGPTPTP